MLRNIGHNLWMSPHSASEAEKFPTELRVQKYEYDSRFSLKILHKNSELEAFFAHRAANSNSQDFWVVHFD